MMQNSSGKNRRYRFNRDSFLAVYIAFSGLVLLATMILTVLTTFLMLKGMKPNMYIPLVPAAVYIAVSLIVLTVLIFKMRREK